MNVRGVIEGFYGPPWTHAERLDLIRFCGAHGLDTWVHAPKDDPYHRQRWRDPYPEPELEQLTELVREADRHGIEFAYAIAPGLSIRAGDESELDALEAKRAQLRQAGVRTFQLLWDDIEREAVPFKAQAEIANRFAGGKALVVCPLGYAGTGDSDYRQAFARRLDPQVVLYWTGPEVVSIAVTREELDLAVRRFAGHELLLWDNYPVNDWAPDTLFLGPLRGRDPRIAERLHGIVANGMVQCAPSKLALATVADWARDPFSYDPLESFARALREHGEEVHDALRTLAPARADGVKPPNDLPALVEALAFGVDAATGVVLLEPFV
jgi:hyaluronoglucosaminidase